MLAGQQGRRGGAASVTLCDWPSVGTAGTPSLQTRFGASGVTRCHSGGVGVQVREPPFSPLPSPVCLDVGDGRGGVLRVTGLGRGVWGVSAVREPCEGPAGAPAGGGRAWEGSGHSEAVPWGSAGTSFTGDLGDAEECGRG